MATTDRSKKPTTSPEINPIENDPDYKRILQQESLRYLQTNDTEYFNNNYSGVAPSGYLIDKNGNETDSLPSQNITGGWTDVQAYAQRSFKKQFPQKFRMYNPQPILTRQEYRQVTIEQRRQEALRRQYEKERTLREMEMETFSPARQSSDAPEDRKIGKDATISFEGTGGNISSTVHENRSHAEDVEPTITASQNLIQEPVPNQPATPSNTSEQASDATSAEAPISPDSLETNTQEGLSSPTSSDSTGEGPSKSRLGRTVGIIGKSLSIPTLPGAIKDVRNQNGTRDEGASGQNQSGNMSSHSGRRSSLSGKVAKGLFAPTAFAWAVKKMLPKKSQGESSQVLMSTNQGFVSGRISSRTKERETGRETIEEIERIGRERGTSGHRKEKKTTKARGILFKSLFLPSTVGYLFKKIFPKHSKVISSFFGKEEQRLPSEHTEVRDYQRVWNNKTLQRTTEQRAENKSRLNRLKSHIARVGSYATFAPVAAHRGIKAYRQRKKQQHSQVGSQQQSQQPSPHSGKIRRRITQGKTAVYEWSTLPGVTKKAWRNLVLPRFSRFSNGTERRQGNISMVGQFAKRGVNRIAIQVAKKAVIRAGAFLFTSTAGVTILIAAAVVLIFIVTITFIIIAISGGGGGGLQAGGSTPGGSIPPGPSENIIPGFTLTKSVSTTTLSNPAEITYTISFSNTGTIPTNQITVYDQIPPNTTLVEGKTTKDFSIEGNLILWNLSSTSNTSPLTFTVLPTKTDVSITNQAFALVTQSATGGGGGDLQAILPPSHTPSALSDAEQQKVVDQIKAQPDLISAYMQAEEKTGVPWQILAGLHFREGGLNPNTSLVSGRPIGENEPDIVRGGGCSSTYTPGEPVALPGGGCGFRTFADSAIYAANHFKGKNGGNTPGSFTELTKSLSYYNGGGNANCGKTPYQNCPAQFTGDDDTYVMSFFDAPHEEMYIVYCADFTLCNPPVRDQRPGVASVIMGLNRFY